MKVMMQKRNTVIENREKDELCFDAGRLIHVLFLKIAQAPSDRPQLLRLPVRVLSFPTCTMIFNLKFINIHWPI